MVGLSLRGVAAESADLHPLSWSVEGGAGEEVGNGVVVKSPDPALAVERPELEGIPYRWSGALELASVMGSQRGVLAPESVKIPLKGVTAAVSRLHLLHSLEGEERPGRPLYQVVLHFRNGGRLVFPIAYGVHVLSPGLGRGVEVKGLADSASAQVWPPVAAAGSEAGRQVSVPASASRTVYRTTLSWAASTEVVEALEMVSLFPNAVPTLWAVTLDGRPVESRGAGVAGGSISGSWPLMKLPESVWKQSMSVKVVDGDGRKALAGARVSLAIHSGEAAWLWARGTTDGEGKIQFRYPPSVVVGWIVTAEAEGHSPRVERKERGGASGDWLMTLEKGRVVGGFVRGIDGVGLSNASVRVVRVTRDGPREFSRLDWDEVRTDAQGAWKSGRFPQVLETWKGRKESGTVGPAAGEGAVERVLGPAQDGPVDLKSVSSLTRLGNRGQARVSAAMGEGGAAYFVEVSHPDWRTASAAIVTGREDGGEWAGLMTIALDALLARTNVMVMKPPYLLRGVVSNKEGQFLEGALLTIERSGKPGLALGRTDARGRFQVGLRPESWAGEEMVRFVVSKDGYSPFEWGLGSGSEFGDELQSEIIPVTLGKPVPMVLNVVDQMGGPAPGVEIRVRAVDGNGGVGARGVTDSQGRWVWTNGTPGSVALTLGGASYARLNYRMDWGSEPLTVSVSRQSMVYGSVVDAESGQSLPEFTVVRGQTYSVGEPMRWDRRNPMPGRQGQFNIRLEDSYQGRLGVMVEAPGYLPGAVTDLRGAGWFTNVFKLKKGVGLDGVVARADGKPIPGVTVVLLDPSETVYMTAGGVIQRQAGQGSVKSGADGRFRFAPRWQADYLVAAHEEGWCEMTVEEFTKNRVLTLKPWARVEGECRIGSGVPTNQVVRLQRAYTRVLNSPRSSDPVVVEYQYALEAHRKFVFERVPPCDLDLLLQYPTVYRRNGGPIALSHRTAVQAVAGGTQRVVMGGGGVKVEGRVRIMGGDPEQVDWKYDVHRLSLVQAMLPGLPGLSWDGKTTAEERQKREDEYRLASTRFWKTKEAVEWQRRQRDYVAVFDSTGRFVIENVPPGRYSLRIAPTEVREDYYSYRELGQLTMEVVVAGTAVDLGELKLKIRGGVKVGRNAPPLEFQPLAGEKFTLPGMKGTNVVLYFWASWAGGTADKNVLKDLEGTFGKDGGLKVVCINLDGDLETARKMVEGGAMPGVQVYGGGNWSQEGPAADLGLESFPQAIVIDANGKVVGTGLRGAGIRNSVRNMVKNAAREAELRLKPPAPVDPVPR